MCIRDRFKVIGDPTEGALLTAAAKAGLEREKLTAALPRIHEYPFDSTRKLKSTVHRGELGLSWPELKNCRFWLLTKGCLLYTSIFPFPPKEPC